MSKVQKIMAAVAILLAGGAVTLQQALQQAEQDEGITLTCDDWYEFLDDPSVASTGLIAAAVAHLVPANCSEGKDRVKCWQIGEETVTKQYRGAKQMDGSYEVLTRDVTEPRVCRNGILYDKSGGTESCPVTPNMGLHKPFPCATAYGGRWHREVTKGNPNLAVITELVSDKLKQLGK